MIFFSVWMQFFVLLTPFFVLSMYLSMTQGWSTKKRMHLAVRIGAATALICLVLFYFGNWIFQAFGITLEAFRIGGGALLFLSAVTLVRGASQESKIQGMDENDIAVVPLAIPITVGPGTTGALLVMGAQADTLTIKFLKTGSLLGAVLSLTVILLLGSKVEQLIKRRGITILSKLTGLFLSAMAAEMVFTGIKSFLK